MPETAPEGEIRHVDVRKKWPNEALDFTPWLAKNLGCLGNVLGMKLTCIQTEAPVGGPPFYLDILAKDVERDVNVAIENQLEETDFSHLAQILTYSAGLDARIAIWVATEFVYESAEVLNWLNKWISKEIEFYGVKVEVIENHDSTLTPRFLPVVTPDCWSKELTRPRGAQDPITQKFSNFFRPLIHEMLQTDFAVGSPRQFFDRADRFFPSRFGRDIGYSASFWEDYAWVSLNLRTESVERTNEIFDTLKESQAEIEACLDAHWEWERHDGYTFSTISLKRCGRIDDPPEKLEDTRVWMQEHLPKLKAVLDPHLEKILGESAAIEC